MKSLMLTFCALIVFSGTVITAAQSEVTTLAGTQWKLVSYGISGEETPVLDDSLVTLEFQDAQRVTGTGGCNGYGGTYTVTDDTIAFSEIASTKMACEATMQQESDFFAALVSTGRFEMTADGLTIWYEDGTKQLNFVPADGNPLLDYVWQLVSYGVPGDETPVVEGSIVTLDFDEMGHVAGTGGCNSYSGNYVLQDNTMIITEVFNSLVLCLAPGITVQETDFFAALRSASRYELSEDDEMLTLWYDDGAKQLNFVATVESKLMNKEWRLISYGTAGEETPVIPGSLVTLVFGEENQAGGNGGCNGYGGTYTIETDTITFSDIISTLMACADNAITQQESEYFAALQTAGQFETGKNTLTIWYEDGAKQLNFVTGDADTEDTEA